MPLVKIAQFIFYNLKIIFYFYHFFYNIYIFCLTKINSLSNVHYLNNMQIDYGTNFLTTFSENLKWNRVNFAKREASVQQIQISHLFKYGKYI